ncbi:MAG TPA: NUDIX domain-containing protein [Chitinophagaceae bacterium]|nr:NUDIX domain-containing protein [Chitinophagaceae bacterium]
MRTQELRLAVDAVVFGYSKNQGVSVLLVRRKYDPYKDKWALPGGFVCENESLEEAVMRELNEETGVEVNYLEQLYTFGDPRRDPRQRIVSVAYYGLINSSMYEELKAGTDADEASWFNIEHLPVLAFDHRAIISKATDRLRAKIQYQPVGFELLDKKFSFADLEKLYISLLGREIDRRNFRKKIESFDFLEKLPELTRPEGKGRPSNMFRFNKKRYDQLTKKGFFFEI